MIRIRAKTSFNNRSIQRQVQHASFRNLGHAGAAIRLTASRSIRKRKKPSRPGAAPHTPTGHLRRVIRYSVDKGNDNVAIGPTNEYSKSIWNLHEFGGSIRPKPRLIEPKTFRVGDFGPVRKLGRKRFARRRLTTLAQAERAARLIAEENDTLVADSKKRRRYPKRPFMGPALEKLKDRLPKFWKDSVRS